MRFVQRWQRFVQRCQRFGRRWYTWLLTSEAVVARWLRAARDALFGEMTVLAAGTALFAILATVPTLAAVVGVYGLVADPREIHGHLRGLERVLPPEVVVFIGDQLERQAKRSTGEIGFAVATSILVAVYSARGSVRASQLDPRRLAISSVPRSSARVVEHLGERRSAEHVLDPPLQVG